MTKVPSSKGSKIPNRDSSTFVTTTLDAFIFKKAYKPAQEDKRHKSPNAYKAHAYKPVAVDGAGKNNLEKVVPRLPQKKAALWHHPAQENESHKILDAYKHVAVNRADKNNLEKVVHGLPQKKAALRHHPAQKNERHDAYKPVAVNRAGKNNLEKVVPRLPQKKAALWQHPAQENESHKILDAYKHVAVADKNNLEKVVHGLPQKKVPQKKAALRHHPAQKNERHDAYKSVAVNRSGKINLENATVVLNMSLLELLVKLRADNDPGPLVEADDTLTPRPLTANEQAGNNILFTLRTTMKYHQQRLPVLFDTWLTTVNTSNVFLVTDGEDTKWKGRAGMDAKLNHSFYI